MQLPLLSACCLRFWTNLGLGGKCPTLKSILLGQFSLVVAFPVVLRSVVADGEARPLGVVVLDIAFDGLNEAFSALAQFQFEVNVEFFLDPAVQSFVDGVVRGLSGPGHGTYDVRVFNEFIVGHGGIYAALVSMQDNRLQNAFEEAYYILKAIYVLISRTALVGHSSRQDFLGEHVEVEGHLEVVIPEPESRHV